MNDTTPPGSLEDSIRRARARVLDQLAAPDVLYLCATGVGMLAERLTRGIALHLREIPGVPDDWSESVLYGGELDSLSVWMLDDENPRLDAAPTWTGGYPVWLAAACGAQCLLHTSAGSALPESPISSSLVVVEDHIRFGDTNPLVGLGTTDLGPLFPDLTLLHDEELRNCALERAEELGLALEPAVAACTRGPALETPAERKLYSTMGAGVSVQSLAAPLIAAGHAGLRALALVAITDRGERPIDMAGMLGAAESIAPGLEDLMIAMVPDLSQRVRTLSGEALK